MSVFTRFLNLFRRGALDREFEDELRFHLDRRTADYIAKGISRAEAEARARRDFGSVERAKREMQEVRVMKPAKGVAAVIGVAAVLGAGLWLWEMLVPKPPPYYQVTDEGITRPKVLRERKPEYPEAAMAARIQGAVEMTCIVQTTGVCEDVRIAKSLDPMWLDREAVKAIQEWRFEPGRRLGEPVPVMVNIEFWFAYRPDPEKGPGRVSWHPHLPRAVASSPKL